MESSTRLEPTVPDAWLLSMKLTPLFVYAGMRDLLLSNTMIRPAMRLLTCPMRHNQGNVILASLASGEILDCGENRKQCRTSGRTATSRELQLDRGDQMRKPHRGRQTFASDISNREYQVIFKVKNTYEVARKMAHRENFAGDLK